MGRRFYLGAHFIVLQPFLYTYIYFDTEPRCIRHGDATLMLDGARANTLPVRTYVGFRPLLLFLFRLGCFANGWTRHCAPLLSEHIRFVFRFAVIAASTCQSYQIKLDLWMFLGFLSSGDLFSWIDKMIIVSGQYLFYRLAWFGRGARGLLKKQRSHGAITRSNLLGLD